MGQKISRNEQSGRAGGGQGREEKGRADRQTGKGGD
jgi:hypothetical protein